MKKNNLLHWLLVILLVWFSACQPSPPPTSPHTTQPNNSIVQNTTQQPKTVIQSSRRSLLPQSSLSFGGDKLPEDIAATFQELPTNFRTQAYPVTRHGYNLPGVSEYQADINYGNTSPISHPWSSITKDSPRPKYEPYEDYIGMVVEEYQRDSEGYTFASKIKLHHNIMACCTA